MVGIVVNGSSEIPLPWNIRRQVYQPLKLSKYLVCSFIYFIYSTELEMTAISRSNQFVQVSMISRLTKVAE